VVGFRGYAQRDPLNEYKTEGFELFQTLLSSLRRAVTGQLAHAEIQRQPPPPPLTAGQPHHIDATTGEDEMDFDDAVFASAPPPPARPKRDPSNPSTWGKVGRNESCPCGSGKKYKQCHGVVVQA
jgi:preprotein translocase subunit SecA